VVTSEGGIMDVVINILEDVAYHTGCNNSWFVTARELSPIEALASASEDPSEFSPEGESWSFECRTHNTRFMMGKDCPESVAHLKAGESVPLPKKIAEQLIRLGQAAFPTHKHLTEDDVQSTLDRSNALMDSLGLPHMDAEGIKAITRANKKSGYGISRHYAKPGDGQLAGELGVSPEDIAEMRKFSKK